MLRPAKQARLVVTSQDRLSLNLGREIPLLGGIFVLFLVVGATVEWAPSVTSRLRATPRDAFPFSSLEDPNLAFSDEDARAEIVSGKLTLGGLARIFNHAGSNPAAEAFRKSFLSKPELREAVKQYVSTRNAAALRRAVARSPDFAKMYSFFEQNEAFRSIVSGGFHQAPAPEAKAVARVASLSPLPAGADRVIGAAGLETSRVASVPASGRSVGRGDHSSVGAPQAAGAVSQAGGAGPARGPGPDHSYGPAERQGTSGRGYGGDMPAVPDPGPPVLVPVPPSMLAASATNSYTTNNGAGNAGTSFDINAGGDNGDSGAGAGAGDSGD